MLLCYINGTPLRYGRVTHLKKIFLENLYILSLDQISVKFFKQKPRFTSIGRTPDSYFEGQRFDPHLGRHIFCAMIVTRHCTKSGSAVRHI